MSLIRFSDGLISSALTINTLSSNGRCGSWCQASTSGIQPFDYTSCYIRIYKGALPSQSDLTTYHGGNLRTADVLISFNIGLNWTVDAVGLITSNVALPTAASASGVASWFAISSDQSSTSQNMFLIGVVTLPGEGGELVINDLNIVSGTTYSLGALTFKLPTSYSYP